MSYDFVELYIEHIMLPQEERAQFLSELDKESSDLFAVLDDVHRRNGHKAGGPKNLNIMPVLNLSAI
jgi:hypothetical protein